MADSRSNPPRGNWSISQKTNNTSGLYALALINLKQYSGGVSDVTQQLNKNNGTVNKVAFLEFAFRVNPKSMNLEEPAAITITPTQDGGQFIEHQGQIYKNIVINGTTGMRPNRSTNGALIPIVGIANPFATFDADPDTGLPRGERTGFDDLIELRNLFRLYWDYKKDPKKAPYTIMVWQNGKEGEYYVVEPLNFKTDRDASAPLTFTYTIQLRTINRLDVTVLNQQEDSYSERNGVDAFFQRMSDARRVLAAAFMVAQSFTDRTASLGQAAVNEVLTPVNTVLQALTGFVTAGRRFFDIPQNALSTVATSATEVATAIDAIPNNAYVTDGTMTQLTAVSNAYKTIARKCRALAVETALFSTPLSTTISGKARAYANPITGMPATGGSPTDLTNLNATNAAAIATVNGGEDIRGVAQRLLGDAAQWKILVLINQLKPPYISVSGDGNNVLRPGDQILYPTPDAGASPTISPTEVKYTNVTDLTQRLGRDLRLYSRQGTGGVPLYDVAVASSGDIDTVEGMDNLGQALTVKFATEQGELPIHPFFGLQFPLGSKARIQTLIAFQLNARATLLSDNRLDTVEALDTKVAGNAVYIKAAVTIKGYDTTLPLDLSVRR